MNLLRPPNVTTWNGLPLQKGRKRSKETSATEKQDAQRKKKMKCTETVAAYRIDQDSIPEEILANKSPVNKNKLVTNLEPSPVTLQHNAESECREGREQIPTKVEQPRDIGPILLTEHSERVEHSRISKEDTELPIVSDNGKFVDANLKSNPTSTFDSNFESKEERPKELSVLQSLGINTQEATTENLALSRSSTNENLVQCDFDSKCPQIQDVDEEYFLEVTNEIYQTMSTPQKSLLLEGKNSSSEAFDDSKFMQKLLTAIADPPHDIVPNIAMPMEPAKLGNLDEIMLKSSSSDL